MGCIIHMFAEFRSKHSRTVGANKNPKHSPLAWLPVNQPFFPYTMYRASEPEDEIANPSWSYRPYESRSLPFFALLGGVRHTNPPPLHAPRGIPTDVSEWVHRKFMVDEAGRILNPEYTNHSWLTLQELEKAGLWSLVGPITPMGELGKYVCPTWLSVSLPALRHLAGLVGGSENVRLVFCFEE